MIYSNVALGKHGLFFLGTSLRPAIVAVGLLLAVAAQGVETKSTPELWTIGAKNPTGTQYKMASGPWLNLGESNSPVVLPLSIKSGENGLRLTSKHRTIDLAPQTSIDIAQSAPAHLAIGLESGGVIYDLQTMQRVDVTVANKALVAAKAGPGAFPGQSDKACIGGVLFIKPDLVQARNLQGSVAFTDLAARQEHMVDAGNLLCLDLGKKTVSIQNDASSIKMIAAAAPAGGKSVKNVNSPVSDPNPTPTESLGFFSWIGEQSPWVIGTAGTVLVGGVAGGIAIAADDDDDGGDGHHNHHNPSPSQPPGD